jgi:hypothetical protein
MMIRLADNRSRRALWLLLLLLSGYGHDSYSCAMVLRTFGPRFFGMDVYWQEIPEM